MSRHIPYNDPTIRQFDTHSNYGDGVIVDPDETRERRHDTIARCGDRWASVHRPNGSNLLRGAFGVRWWLRAHELAELE